MAILGGAKPFAVPATGAGGTDSDAIHDNVASEISAITAKAAPVSADYLLIEDSEASNAKKSVTVGQVRSYPDAADFTAQSAVSIAPGNALTGDTGDNGVTGTWTGNGQGGTGTLALDTTDQPASGNGAVTMELNLNDDTDDLYVNLSEDVTAGASQMYLSLKMQWQGVVGPGFARSVFDMSGKFRVEVASDVNLGTVHSTVDVGSLSEGVWTRVICPLNSATIRSAGVALNTSFSGPTSTARVEISIADVELLPMTEAMVALAATSGQDVIIQPDYSPTGSEFPVQQITDAVAGGHIDLRSSMRIISDFNGEKYTRQFWIDDTGATDMSEQMASVFAELADGDTLVFPPLGKIQLADIGTGGGSPVDGAIVLLNKKNIHVKQNGCSFFTNDRRVDAFVRINNCYNVRWDDAAMFQLRSDTEEGTSLVDLEVNGALTTSGDDIQLALQNDAVRSSTISQARTKDRRYEWDVVASDSAQIENDLQYELRSPDLTLTSNTQKGDTSVTLADDTVLTWTAGTGTLTVAAGDFLTNGTQVGMLVRKNANNNGTVASITDNNTLVLTGVEGSFSASDTITVGYMKDDASPYFIDDSASFYDDRITKGDIVVNETQSTSSIITVLTATTIETQDDIAFDEGDTISIHHRHDLGTYTLTASPATYTVRAYPSELENFVELHLTKATGIANTITIEEVIAYNKVTYSTSYDAANGFQIEDSEDVWINNFHAEGLGADSVAASSAYNRRVKVTNLTAIGMSRQGISFNHGEDYLLDGFEIIRPARSGVDVEPFTTSWHTYNVYIRNGRVVAPGNYALAMSNFDRVDGLYVENVLMESLENSVNGPTNGLMIGGARGGFVRNCTSYHSGKMNVEGRDMQVYNNIAARIEIAGTRMSSWNNMHNGSASINHSVNASTDSWMHDVQLSLESLYTSTANNTLYPVRLVSSTNSGIIGVKSGIFGKTWSSTFKTPYLLHNTSFPGGLDMKSDPLMDVGQIAGKGITTKGNNTGERGRSVQGGVNITGNVYYYAFPVDSAPDMTFESSPTKEIAETGGLLADETYTYLVRARSEYGGPGGTGETDSGTVSNPTTNAYRFRTQHNKGTTMIRSWSIYRKDSGDTNYPERYDVSLDDLGYIAVEGLKDLEVTALNSFDMGTRLHIRQAGIVLTGNVHDGGGTSNTVFSDASATFSERTGSSGDDKVAAGDTIYNVTDGSKALITSVDSATQLTCDGLTGGSDNQFNDNDVIAIASDTIIGDVGIQTGNVTLADNVQSGAGTNTLFTAASGTFVDDGVLPGMLITCSDTSTATVTAVSQTQILCDGLSGAATFDAGETITITKLWTGSEDETGWEPDNNYSVFIQTRVGSRGVTPVIYPMVSGFTVDWGEATAAADTFDYWIVRLPAAS